MKRVKKTSLGLLSLLGLGISACSSFSEKAVVEKKFDVSLNWIRQIGPEENLAHRKLSAFEPILFEDTVIVGGANSSVSAFYKKRGGLKWSFPIPYGVERAGVLYNGNRLIVGGKDGYVYSLNPSNGELIWKFFASAEILSSMVVEGGSLYFLAGNNVFFKLDADNGERQWVYSRTQSSSFSIRGGSSPLLVGNRLYVGFSDGFLVCLDKSKGSLLWERKLSLPGRFSDVDSRPITDGERLFVSSYDGALYALSLSSGDVEWRVEKGGYSNPILVDKKILYPGSKGQLFLIDAYSGKELWSYKLKAGVASEPLAFENLWAVSTSAGDTLVFDSNSKEILGHYQPGKGSLAKPVWDKETKSLFINSNAGNLHSVRLGWKDPRLDWSWQK